MLGELNKKFHNSYTDQGLSSIVAISEKVRRIGAEKICEVVKELQSGIMV
jgi:hypothetical protein